MIFEKKGKKRKHHNKRLRRFSDKSDAEIAYGAAHRLKTRLLLCKQNEKKNIYMKNRIEVFLRKYSSI